MFKISEKLVLRTLFYIIGVKILFKYQIKKNLLDYEEIFKRLDLTDMIIILNALYETISVRFTKNVTV